MREFHSIAAMIDGLGGNKAVADHVSDFLGEEITPSAVSEMKRRGSMPVEYWPAIIALAKEKRVRGVSLESIALVCIAAKTPDQGRESVPA